MNKVDILTVDYSVPRVVYVVGSAPEDQAVYDSIPPDAFVIVVNGAIQCPLPVTPALWMLGDPETLKKPYFKTSYKNIRQSGYDLGPDGIKAGGPVVPIISEILLDKIPDVKLFYHPDPRFYESGKFERAKGSLRIGATIAGCAVQLAFYLGAREIRLVGIRMHGDDYFDGSKHEDSTRKQSDWKHREQWNWMVNVLRAEEGVKIVHLRDMPPDAITVAHAQSDSVTLPLQSIEIPQRVVILGSGPNGVKAYDRIKPDDYVIAVNGAIGIKHQNIRPRMWILADGMTPSRDYFQPGCERCDREGIIKVWSCAVTDRAGGIQPDRKFSMVHEHTPGFRHVPDRFRPDATVVGIAIDMAYRAGAKFVELCGVDMSGARYFDGTESPGNCDDKHGAIWDMRDELDDEIRWMHTHGVHVSTLSDTMLMEPHAVPDSPLPSVALICMAFNPVYTKTAIFCAAIQDYPDHLKTLYLMTQNGEQPPVGHDLPFRVVQSDVSGKWPELWHLKLMRFFELATEDYIAFFDEDDFFEPDYISKAVNAMREGGYDMVWNFENKLTDRFSIRRGYYRSAIGTAVIPREVAFNAAKQIWLDFYKSPWEPGAQSTGISQGNRGAQDATFSKLLVSCLEKICVNHNGEFESGKRIGLHNGVRWYRFHLNSNTCSGRKDEECIDYWMPEAWYKDTKFEETRTRKRNENKY